MGHSRGRLFDLCRHDCLSTHPAIARGIFTGSDHLPNIQLSLSPTPGPVVSYRGAKVCRLLPMHRDIFCFRCGCVALPARSALGTHGNPSPQMVIISRSPTLCRRRGHPFRHLGEHSLDAVHHRRIVGWCRAVLCLARYYGFDAEPQVVLQAD